MKSSLPSPTPEFTAYAVGICTASICTSLPIEEALIRMNQETLIRMNQERPTVIASGWQKSDDETFRSGEPNPCPCHDSPQTHKHYLLEC